MKDECSEEDVGSPVARLVSAAEDLLQNMIDAGEFGPEDPDPDDEGQFPHDEDGDPWYPDVWELNEALPAVTDNVSLYVAAPALLAALRELLAIGEGGVIERRETGKPTWSALDAVRTIARAAIAKAGG